MSFLEVTNDEFVKLQLRSMISDPERKKLIKRDLRKLGLYDRKSGFGHYPDFFRTELRKISKTPHKRRMRSTGVKEKLEKKEFAKPELPPLNQLKSGKKIGIVNTEFFKKGKIPVGSCILYMLVNKILVPPAPEVFDLKISRKYESDIDSKFVPYYISSFLCVLSNLTKILVGTAMPLAQDFKKNVSSVFNLILGINGANRKVYLRNKDARIANYLNSKAWPAIISETLNKFYFKKYTTLNEQYFEDFIVTYIFTHNSHNQTRLCFDLYDRYSLQYITSKHAYSFFESAIFPLIKNDLFVMIDYMSNDRYIEETAKLKKLGTRIIPSEIVKTIESEPKKMTFKAFSKLNFDQKFPDMLLALAYALFDEQGPNTLTSYFSIPKFKISTIGNSLSLSRPVNICQSYLKELYLYNKMIKSEVKNYKPTADAFVPELVKGAVVTFMLGCNAEYLCEYHELIATSSSFKEASLLMFGKNCPMIMERLYDHISYPNSLSISLWEFLNYVEGYFSEEGKHQRSFDIYDANKDGNISVVELIKSIDSGEFSLSPQLEEEVNKLVEIMESKRNATPNGGGLIDKAAYQSVITTPGFPGFIKERLLYNYKNKDALYQKRYEQLVAEI